MAVTVRPLRDDEIRLYLQIHERGIRGLAASHYSQDAIEGWVVPATAENVRRLTLNADREIRLLAELDGKPVGIGALVLETSELRAVLHASLNAEQFYSDLGYSVLERTEVVLPNDHRMAAVVMGKDL